MSLPDSLRGLRLKEFEIFQVVSRAKSVREAARRLDLTPGEVSKALRSFETKIGLSLLKRSSSGVLLSEAGSEIALIIEELLETATKIDSQTQRTERQKRQQISVASTSFLITHLLSPELTRLFAKNPAQSFRFIDLSPDEIVPSGLRGAFEMAFHFGKIDWPSTWSSRKLGEVRWVLCARDKHPVGERPTLAQVAKYPFIVPTYWTAEGFVHGNDNFPVPIRKRIQGYETSTADAAISIVTNSDQLAFLPHVLAKPFIDDGHLMICHVKDLKDVAKELYVSIRSDRIIAQTYSTICDHFEEKLDEGALTD